MIRPLAARLMAGFLAAAAVLQPVHAAGPVSLLKGIVIHRSDLGADYVKVFTGAGVQPIPETGFTYDRNLWLRHGYLGGWTANFGHDTAGAKHQMDGQIFSDVDAFSSQASAHWAFLRERKVYRTSAPLALTAVGDESAAFGLKGQWTVVAFRRGRYLCLAVGNDRDNRPSRVVRLALLMDARARNR